MDDESLVRMGSAEQLQELGYQVLEAQDGPSALLNSERQAGIEMLVTDVGLPNGMNGRQLADAMRSKAPTLPVLFITGYAEKAILDRGDLDERTRVLAKPFTVKPLEDTFGIPLQQSRAKLRQLSACARRGLEIGGKALVVTFDKVQGTSQKR